MKDDETWLEIRTLWRDVGGPELRVSGEGMKGGIEGKERGEGETVLGVMLRG